MSSKTLTCHSCKCPTTEGDIRRVNGFFEAMAIEEFTFTIDFLGLHRCEGPPEEFIDGSANVCPKCLSAARTEYQP